MVDQSSKKGDSFVDISPSGQVETTLSLETLV